MALGFQDPALLWLTAAAAAVPIAAHLVARTRPPEKSFPTVEFLRRAMRRVWRLRRPRDLLLLLLRTAGIAALALAFARPLWLSGEDVTGLAETKHLMLVVDRTGSMGSVSGGQSRFSLAKSRAVDALRNAGRLDSVNLVWIDATPETVYPGMGRAIGPLETALNEAEVSGEAGDAAAALRLALEQLDGLEGKKEMLVFSDFQAGTWDGTLPDLPPSIRAIAVPSGDPAANLALAGLELDPPMPLVGESIQILGRVRNFSDESRTARVAVTVGELRQVRSVEIAPRAEGQILVEAQSPSGDEEFLVKATLEGVEDSLRADDTRWAVGKRRDPLRVALVFAPNSVTDFEHEVWSRLLRSFAWTRQTDDAAAAEVLILAGAPDSQESAAKEILKKGGSVIFRPTSAHAGSDEWFDKLQPGGGHWETLGTDAQGWRLRIPTEVESDALFRLFSLGDYGDPSSGITKSRWRTAAAGGELLVYEDGFPAVWRGNFGGGTVWWWNLPLDLEQSTWPNQPAFLPLIGELLLLSRPRELPPLHTSNAPGQIARWEPDRFPEGGSVVLLDGDGRSIPLAENSGAGVLAYHTSSNLQPGAYRWALRDTELERDIILAHTAVNFPETEMDGQPIDSTVIERWTQSQSPGGFGRKLNWATLREGQPLWQWFLSAALILFALEAAILLLDRRSIGNQPATVRA